MATGVVLAGVMTLASPAADADHEYVRQWPVPTEAQGIAVGPAGVYVSNDESASTPSKVTRYTRAGRLTGTFGSFERPGADGLSVGPDGRVWVVDFPGTIKVFDAGGAELEQQAVIDSCGTGAEVVVQDVDVDARGELYQAIYDNCALGDSGARKVVARMLAGWRPVNAWGGLDGSASDGEFGRSPIAVASDGRGNVYVSDSGNHRIQQFTSNGTFVRKWGQLGHRPGQFNEPRGIAIGPSGDVFVADRNNDRVQRFAPDGALREVIRMPSRLRYEGNPIDVDVDADGRLYVLTADFATEDEVNVFAPVASGSAGTRIPKQTLRYRRQRIVVRVRCAGTRTCRGTVRIGKGGRAIGSRRYRVAAGRTASVAVTPTSSARRQIRSMQTVTVTLEPRTGKSASRRLTLRR